MRAGTFGVSLSFAGAVAAAAAAAPARMDFIAQYAAASLVISGRGASLADPAAILAAEHAAAPDRVALLPFVQPPAVALLLAPLATLPFEIAFVAMALVDGALVLAALVLLLPRTRGAAGTAALLLVAPPAAIAIAQGQTSPLALLLVAVAVRRGPRAGGLALGLSLVRLQTAPLLLFAALLDPARRAWALAGALIVVAASAAVVGAEGLVRYAGTLAGASEWLVTGEFGHAGSIGWTGLAVWLGVAPLGLAASALSLVAGAVAVARSPGPDRPRVAAAWSLLASPPLLMHDALLAYPAALSPASRRRAWDAVSSVVWIGHVLVAPVAVLWSLALAIGATREAGRA